MGMPLIQSITLIQMRRDVWNLVFREVMGCSRVAKAMTSTRTGKLTTTASKRRVNVRRCMLSLDWAFPTATFLAKYYAPIPGVGGRSAELFLRFLRRRIFRNKKRLPLRSRIQPTYLSDPLGVNPTLPDGERHA